MSGSRLNQALQLLLQSPPGQTTQVYHDLRGILFDAEANSVDKIDDAKLQAAASIALEEYNTQQLIPVSVDGIKDQTVLCQAAQLPSSASSSTANANADGASLKRYAHPRAQKSFLFDHIKRTTAGIEDLPVDQDAEPIRSAIEKCVDEYVKDRYLDGVSSVFTVSNVPLRTSVKSAQQQQEEAAAQTAADPAANTAAPSSGGSAQEKSGTDEMDTEEPAAGSAPASADAKEGEKPSEDAKEDDEAAIKDDPVDAVESAQAVQDSSSSAVDQDSIQQADDPMEPEVQIEKNFKYVIHHVGNRYNLSNFWSGRWRASYVLDPEARTLSSTLSVQVHYFENGNVQLNASKPRTFSLPSSVDFTHSSSNANSSSWKVGAKELVKVIQCHEDLYQKALEQTYDELAEKAFKALRRQLPLTRQKIDWDKVLNYKIGDQLAKS